MNEPQVVAYFVRHGETEMNAEGRFRGSKTDPPLTEKGIRDAQEARDYLRNQSLGDAWTSSKQRAEHTAEIILEPHGKAASPTDGLWPLDVGYLSGERKVDHKDDIDYFQRNPSLPIPGGESLQEFRGRVKPSILLPIRRGIENGKPSVVAAHSSIIHEVGHLIHNDHTSALVKPGGITAVTYDGKYFRAKPVHRPAPKNEEDSTLA